MSDQVVLDSNEIPLKRGDHIWNLNQKFLTHDRTGIIVEIVNEDHLRYSPEGDPCGIMNESPWLVQKIKDGKDGLRNDWRDKCDDLEKQLKEIREKVEKMERVGAAMNHECAYRDGELWQDILKATGAPSE